MSPPNTSRIVFASFALDTQALELWHQGVRLPLEPLPAKLLARLAQSSGALVSRRELLHLGWGDTAGVTDQALNTCIHEIRQALRRAGDKRVRLETLRLRGYRLFVETAHNEETRWSRARRLIPWVGGLVAGIAVVIAGSLARDRSAAPPMPEAAQQYSARARYLADETQDLAAARAVLDTARIRFPQVAALHAQWSEVSALTGALDDARAAADLALRLDPRQVAAHRAHATIALLHGAWDAADAALAQATALDAADSRTLTALAFRRVIQGRFAEMDSLVRQALQKDPLSVATQRDAGILYLLAGKYTDAERYCRETLRFKPRSVWATDCLFDVMTLTGRVVEAAEWGRRLLRLYGAPETATDSPAKAVAATESWRLAAWSRAVSRGANPFGLALAYAANGRVHEALDALQAAAARPSLGVLTIAVDPRLAALRGHAEFAELLQRLKLTA